jgi:GT2 family glycosyltransferase
VQSCLETREQLDCDVVVADDASSDGSVEELRRRFPEVQVVAHAERQGVSPTRDLAARTSPGDVLVFLDSHCKPEPGAIARLVADVEELDGQAVVTPRVAMLDCQHWRNDLSRAGNGSRMDLERFDYCGFLRAERMRLYWGPTSHRFYESPALLGCCLAVSRTLYEKLWGFDPGMRVWGVEDLDFGLKAWLLGHPVLHDAVPVVGHHFRTSFDNYPVPGGHVVANQLRMARKHFSDPVWDEWVQRGCARQPVSLWESAWQIFEQGRASVERERGYLLTHRRRDEFWYAARFGLAWPQRPGSTADDAGRAKLSSAHG